MPHDLDIIAQLEQQIGKPLPRLEKIEFHDNAPIGYVLNECEEVGRLSLSKTEISDITRLQGLINLQDLNLNDNKLTDVSALQGLTNLQSLELGQNRLTDVSALQGLTNLQSLGLEDNQLTDVSALQGLINLLYLDLSENQLTDVSALQGLTNLQTLHLLDNQLTDVSALQDLTNLQWLVLNKNPIKSFPRTLLGLGLHIGFDCKELGITFSQNYLEDPPFEIVIQGKEAIIAYFESRDKRPLNEVKVLVLGDGEAGKTSLIKCLFGEPFDEQQPKTPGIALREQEWHVEIRERQFEQNLKVRFWDFGGQQIMHATHQFFLSERSVYLLVLDNRKDEQPEYWLRHIAAFGGNSPVLLVINKLDEHRPAQCDPAALQAQFPQIRGIYRTSCKSGEGIAELTEGLRRTLPDAELVQTKLAASWIAVKNRLEERTDSWISYETYLDLCEQEAVSDKAAQKTLIGFLHDLGVVLHFPDAMGLRHTHVLNPRWVTTAVYKLITSEQVAAEHGLLRLDDLDTLLRPRSDDDFSYPRAAHPYIIDLMKKFELCYPLDDETVLIPDLLALSKPAFAFEEDTLLRFRLRYEFLPRSIMPRFISKMYRDIKDELRWRTGVVLEDHGLQACALAEVNYESKTLALRVNGAQRREYLAILRKTLRDIHNTFKNLRPVELIPLPDHPEITLEYEELIELERMGETTIPIGKLRKRYNIRELLGEVMTETELSRLTKTVARLYDVAETIDSKQDQQLNKLDHIEGLLNDVMNELRQQLHAGQIDEDGFCAKVSDEIERRFREIDFRYIQKTLTDDFPYLQSFDFSQKYGRFLLTAEYLYRESLSGRMQLAELDASTIIIEYAKIVDGILHDHVGEQMNKGVRNRLLNRRKKPQIREPYTIGTWPHLTRCEEYRDWVQQFFTRDTELIAFLQFDVGRLTKAIKDIRNDAAHAETHTLIEAQKMRTALLETHDNHRKTLMEWCVNILEYQ